MMSCYSFISEFEENEDILNYTYYINEGWQAFESINLSDTLLIEEHADYYNLALEMFVLSIQWLTGANECLIDVKYCQLTRDTTHFF